MIKIHQNTLFVLLTLIVSLPVSAEVLKQFNLKVDTNSKQVLLNKTTQVTLNAIVTLRGLEEDSQGQWWAIKADNIVLNGIHSDPSYELAFAFQTKSSGTINNFWFPKELSDVHIQKLKGLAYYFQWQNIENKVNMFEQDNTGIFDVEYLPSENSMVRKTKISYHSTKDYQIKVIESQHEILKSNNFFEYCVGNEKLLFEHDISMMSLIVNQEYQIISRDSIFPSTLLELPIDRNLWPRVSKINKNVDSDIALQQSMLTQMLANKDLRIIPSNELATQLARYTEGLDVIELMIISDTIEESSYLRLFNALGQIDNKNSQLLLSSLIINDKVPDNVKFLSMRAFTKGNFALTFQAYNNVLTLLEEGIQSDDIVLKSSLIHGVGSLLGQRLPNEFTKDIKNVLLAKMRSESSDIELATYISSIGNTKDPDYVVDIQEYKESTSVNVRSSVAETLGRIQSEESHKILTEMLTSELNGSSKVQSSILRSLSNYPVDDQILEQTLNYIDKSTDEGVRYNAIDLMNKKKLSEDNKIVINSLMKKETNKKNFTAMANLLHQ